LQKRPDPHVQTRAKNICLGANVSERAPSAPTAIDSHGIPKFKRIGVHLAQNGTPIWSWHFRLHLGRSLSGHGVIRLSYPREASVTFTGEGRRFSVSCSGKATLRSFCSGQEEAENANMGSFYAAKVPPLRGMNRECYWVSFAEFPLLSVWACPSLHLLVLHTRACSVCVVDAQVQRPWLTFVRSVRCRSNL
jgi:hypothetical protein